MLHTKPSLLPGSATSTKTALLQIARLLQRDTTPEIKHINTAEPTPVVPATLTTSEGACALESTSLPPPQEQHS